MITTNSAPFLRDIRLNGLLNRGLPRLEGTRGEKRGFSQRLLHCTHNRPANHLGVPAKVLALIFLGLVVFGAVGARAEDAAAAKVKAPEFVPIVVDQQQYAAAMDYLGGLTFKQAAPMVRWLNELEDRAKGQWEADHGGKLAEEKK